MTAPDPLDEIQSRTDAATEGPWMAQEFDTNPGDEGSCIIAGEGMESRAIAYSIPYPWHTEKETVADAEFIAHAREDVPKLVAALREVVTIMDQLDIDRADGRIVMASQIQLAVRDTIREALNG